MNYFESGDVVRSIDKIFAPESTPQRRILTSEARRKLGIYLTGHNALGQFGTIAAMYAKTGMLCTPFAETIIERIESAIRHEKIKIFA